MSARRWLCPLCGAGCLGPERPRRDDVRRYCLACSAKTGRLVERSCPALEKARADRSEKRAALTTRKRERERAAMIERCTAGGVDLVAEAHRFGKLPTLSGRFRRGFPDIEFRRSTTKIHSSGHCWYSGGHAGNARIVVTIGLDPLDAPATLLHEMVHAAYPEGHTARFWSMVQRSAREAWPTARFDFASARGGWQVQAAIRNGLFDLQQHPTSARENTR